MKYILPKLNYSYDALEPYIDKETMFIHHTKHHQGYINNLNDALAKHPELDNLTLETLLTNLNTLPEDIRTAVRNNGGGHYNHQLFWKIIGPAQNRGPQGPLLDAIEKDFGSFEHFQNEFANAAKSRFGSGWAWLYVDSNNNLKITSTPNQDTPLLEGKPILALDVWEHAYYLKYQNRRPDYINNFWNVVNWNKVEKLYEDTL